MKKIVSIILALLLVNTLSAQEYVNSFISKFGGDKGLEVVNIGKQMLNMLSNLRADDAELNDAIKGLESIKIITSASDENCRKYFKHAYEQLTKKSQGFQELMSVREETESVYIMTRESDGIVRDLVLLTGGESDFSMICLSGEINMETIGKLAKGMNIGQLNKLNNTDKNKTNTK